MNRLPRPFLGQMCVAAGAVVIAAASASAQQPDKSARRVGEIAANDVYVRSGPSSNHYPVLKLSAGDRVTIVSDDKSKEWIEILPPAGAFSYISGDYVESADQKTGVVSGNNVRVRAGSALPDFAKQMYVVQTKLRRGAPVTILSKQPDGFLRIKPPPGVTLWVYREYVRPLPGAATAEPSSDKTARRPTATPSTGESETAPVASKPADATNEPSQPPQQPTAFPGFPDTPQRLALKELDERAAAELKKPPAQRDFAPQIERYRDLARQEEDEFARRYAQVRIGELGNMATLASAVRTVERLDDQADSRRRSFLDERAKIRASLPGVPTGFDAEGVLRPSALYPPGSYPERYRLVEPLGRRERTVGYVEVRPNLQIDVSDLLGRRVGVRASGKRLQAGGVKPVPIYVAGEIVPLEPATDTSQPATDETPPSTGDGDEANENP